MASLHWFSRCLLSTCCIHGSDLGREVQLWADAVPWSLYFGGKVNKWINRMTPDSAQCFRRQYHFPSPGLLVSSGLYQTLPTSMFIPVNPSVSHAATKRHLWSCFSVILIAYNPRSWGPFWSRCSPVLQLLLSFPIFPPSTTAAVGSLQVARSAMLFHAFLLFS